MMQAIWINPRNVFVSLSSIAISLLSLFFTFDAMLLRERI